MTTADRDESPMRRALDLARRGAGRVEPNPLVGAVVTTAEGVVIGEGWHAAFGGPHAEVAALAAAGSHARGGTLYVTLEPCCHHGKTPPCTEAILAAGVARVVVGCQDPYPAVAGAGLGRLRAAGVAVTLGVCAAEAARLVAPFRTLLERGRPWVIAKWAMSLDGRVATPGGESRWISSAESRALVHELRGRMDAILVGSGTALADDPLLTARPPGPRTPLRIVLDGRARLSPTSRLARTARDVPVLVAVAAEADRERVRALESAGCEVWMSAAAERPGRLAALFAELGRRRLTNLLVEGGPSVLGGCFDAGLVDEVWAFIAPRIIGGAAAPAAVGGSGFAAIAAAAHLDVEQVGRPGGDLFVSGLVRRGASPPAR